MSKRLVIIDPYNNNISHDKMVEEFHGVLSLTIAIGYVFDKLKMSNI